MAEDVVMVLWKRLARPMRTMMAMLMARRSVHGRKPYATTCPHCQADMNCLHTNITAVCYHYGGGNNNDANSNNNSIIIMVINNTDDDDNYGDDDDDDDDDDNNNNNNNRI